MHIRAGNPRADRSRPDTYSSVNLAQEPTGPASSSCDRMSTSRQRKLNSNPKSNGAQDALRVGPGLSGTDADRSEISLICIYKMYTLLHVWNPVWKLRKAPLHTLLHRSKGESAPRVKPITLRNRRLVLKHRLRRILSKIANSSGKLQSVLLDLCHGQRVKFRCQLVSRCRLGFRRHLSALFETK